MGRKIKHYSSGYQIRRKKQRRVLSSVLFGLLLVLLVFVGYAGARALNELRLQQEKSFPCPVVQSRPRIFPLHLKAILYCPNWIPIQAGSRRAQSQKVTVKQKHFTQNMAMQRVGTSL